MCKVQDHLGNGYNSKKAMLDFWGVNQQTYYKRRRSDWSLKEALTGVKEQEIVVHDHLGKGFYSECAMCRYWEVSQATFRLRKESGLPLKDCLDKNYKYEKEVYTDHEGNEFESLDLMCVHWGISRSTYYNRAREHFKLKEILTGLDDNGKSIFGSCCEEDHEGVKHETYKKLFSHWGIDYKFGMNLRHNLGLTAKEITSKYGVR
jgi:hypothetical protein